MQVNLLYGNLQPRCCSSHRHAFEHHVFIFFFLKSEFGMFMSYLWMQPENDEQILITTRGWVFDRLQTNIAILA